MFRRTRSEDGAVAVEAALITPLLFLLVMGIVELAFLMRDDVALTSLVRTAGRTASANPGAGPAGVDAEGDCVAPCSGGNVPKLAQLAANAIQRAGTALPEDSITELWIYRANDKGFPGANGSTAMSCSINCIQYRWVKAKDEFRYYTGTWLSKGISACANNNPDAVGVYLKSRHDFNTNVFSSAVDIEDHAVFTFEPLPNAICGADQHS